MKRIAKILATLIVAVALISGLTSCQKKITTQVKSITTLVLDQTAETLLKNAKTIQFDSGYAYVVGLEVYGEYEMEDNDDDRDYDNDNSKHDEMYSDNDDDSDDQYFYVSVDVRTKIDLATGSYELPLEFDLAQTTYDDIKIILHLNALDGNNAIEVFGTYYDLNNNPVPVHFIYRDSISIVSEYDDDYDGIDEDLVVGDSIPAFVIYIKPAKWFREVTSDMLENATRYNGVIVISDTSNVNIYNEIVPYIGKMCDMKEESRERFEMEYEEDHDMDNDRDD